MYQGLAAHYLACSTFPLEAGHTCLIHAAAGGTAQLLTQVCDRAANSIITACMHSVMLYAQCHAVYIYALWILRLQIAKLRGARVLATCSTEEKAEVARSCGAGIAQQRVEWKGCVT